MRSKPPQQADSAVKAVRLTRYLVLLVMLGLAVHLILPQIASIQHSYQVIQEMILWVVGLAFLAQIASYLGSGYLLKALVRLSGNTLSIINGTLITLAGASFGIVAGGLVGSSAAIMRWMQKKNIPPDAATLAGTLPVLFNDIVLITITLVGLIHLLTVHQLTTLQAVSFGLVVLFLTGLASILVLSQRKGEAVIRLAENAGTRLSQLFHRPYEPHRIRDYLERLFKAVSILLSGGWRGPLLGAVLNAVFDMLTLYLLFVAARNPVSLGVLLTGYGLPLLIGRMAFIIPGGVGVVESTMAALYTSLGVPYALAVVVVLAYRVISFWLPLVLGFPLIFVLERRDKDSR